jgi:CheY-like chemotaxis protein
MTALRVLHVDDEPDIREVVEISLALDPDFVTRSCRSGEEALTVAADWPPDIIILDVMMPVMDGPATLARLRSDIDTAAIPVVFMTARAQSRELDQFRSLGAVGVIAKPFDPMTLAAAVRSYMVPKSDVLAALRDAFLQRADDDAVALRQHRSRLNGTAALPTLAGIRDIAHGLAGAGGIFGFDDISSAAAALEEAVIDRNGAGTMEGIVTALDSLLIHVETKGVRRERSRLDA